MSDQTDDDEAGAEEVAPPPTPAESQPPGLPQPGDVVAERYRIEREIGHGGMAVVYAATQLSGGNRQVALKWLFQGRSHREERRRRFLREARAAGSIQHRNVVRVYDAGEHQDGVYLVMELVEGESLTKHMARGKLEPRDAIDLLMTAMRGVAAAHKQGIIHRDLKPDNLYVCKARGDTGKLELKVLDFGLSKLIGPAADSLHTLPGTLVGTPQYMAPEQADGRLGAISERSDVYTLGVILYEAIAGQRPFESETLAGQLMKIAHDEPTPLRDVIDVPEDLADTIMWALARDPLQRPAHVEDFAIELERFGTVGFADNGRMSEAKGSQRPRKLSERSPAPAPASMRAPAGVPASVAPPPAQATPASNAASGSRAPWWIGWTAGAIALLAIGAFAYFRTQPPNLEAASEPARSSAAVPAPAPPASPVAAPTQPSAPPEPVSAPATLALPDAGMQPPSTPPPASDAAGKRARSAAREPRPLAPVAAPITPPASETPPAEEAAPTKLRAKRSPGVADPWAD